MQMRMHSGQPAADEAADEAADAMIFLTSAMPWKGIVFFPALLGFGFRLL
jgi:hypothetical protein